MTINVPITLTPEEINDIICTAIEGGITYWCKSYMGHGDNLTLDGADQLVVEYGETVTRASDIKYAYEWLGFGGYLTLEEDKSELDAENFDGDGNYKYTGMTHRLTLDSFKAGLEKWIAKNINSVEIVNRSPRRLEPRYLTIETGNIDAGDADSIVQYAIFGELKYG